MGLKTFTHSSTSHSQEMLEKLNALRNEGHLCDVTIRVQDKLFQAHKVVLACCSEFFRSKLVGRPEEEDKFVLDLHHVTVSGFAPLLEYAYTSTLSISTENIIDVLAAASYMQMFAVASTCSEFMKSSILWSPGNNNNNNNNMTSDKPHESAQESASSNCALTPLDGSVSPVSSDCSVMERNVPICRESRRKRKSFVTVASPESPLKCTTQMVTTSPQIPNPSPSFSDSTAQPVESSLAFPWTFPFGIDRRFHSDKSKLSESPRCLEQGTPGTSEVVVSRRLSDYLTCESSKVVSSPVQAEEEDVRVKVERLSDEEVQEASSQPVSASQSSLSDQQTVPGSEQVQEELLISPQSSSIGSMDEGVSEGLPSMQSTSNAGGHAEDDERLEGIQYPYHLYISPSARPGTNGPDRPFQCPTCGVRFTRIQNLKQHMLIHSGIKPFQCDRCGKKFTRAYSLKMHRLKHEDYSKRVYQGVRVKHTVKDLLAEKRSRQTNGPRYSGGSTTPPSFVQMAGSHMVPSYYGMRRPFISDSDFCGSTKQFSPDVYSSTLGGKPLGCEPSTMTSYSSFIDSYYPDTFGDYRSTTAFSSSGGSFLSSSALSSLLPSFSGESSHLFL
uniref:Zinc finger and BTB domain-containing protein 44 n=1 Tax=Monopterus albus TaxID=43700 RepID=A0A3Q3QYK4_MONAL